MIRPVSYLIKRAFTSIVVGFFLTITCAYAQTPATPSAAAPKVSSQVVGFEDANGNTLFLHDFKGKVVVINLWATWCAPCVEEMPSLATLQQEYKNKGVVVLALSQDDNISDVISFYKAHALSGILMPFLDSQHKIWFGLQSRGIPTSMIIDRNGKPYKRIEGPVNWQSAPIRKDLDLLTGQR